jgi:autotransporter-associated beta strand protein
MLAVAMSVLVPIVAHADSATWDLNPGSGDWNTAANWTPMGVPNGPADIATFGLSHTTDVSISANTEVNSIIFTTAATNPYAITASPGFTLTISGAGIINNSGLTQNFVTAVNGTFYVGHIVFTNSATAGSSTIFTNNGGLGGSAGGITQFMNTSTAGSGTFINKASAAVGDVFGGATIFSGNSTAANGTFINQGAAIVFGFHSEGRTLFFDNSTASNATFINYGGAATGAQGGVVEFNNGSSAGNGTFINYGATAPFAVGGTTYASTANNATFINNGAAVSGAIYNAGRTFFGGNGGNSTFINNAATVSGAAGGYTYFVGEAANCTFINNGAAVSGAGAGSTQFYSTASNGTFINNGGTVSGASGGFTLFDLNSTANSATLIANSGTGGGEGGSILFAGNSDGGTSRVELFGNGTLDISRHTAPGVTIGSIEGDGDAFLGANTLTVGSNNLSTTFSGVMQDGGTGGSLTKIGTGTLTLSGVNTYTGDTNVNDGVLKVDGSITSNTFVRHRSTLAGTGTINANVMNNHGTVSPGEPLGAPGLLTVVHNYTQAQYATLMIQIAGANAGQFSVLDVLGNANLNGYLDPVLLNGFVPTIGESFIFLNYASLTGGFSRIQNQVFNHGTEQWSVIYQNNDAILTVGPNTIPDQGSTFLLLTLGLLALVGYRRQLLRGQA